MSRRNKDERVCPRALLKAKYDDQLARLRGAMQARGLDALITGGSAQINWLTGYDALLLLTPQVVLFDTDGGHFQSAGIETIFLAKGDDRNASAR